MTTNPDAKIDGFESNLRAFVEGPLADHLCQSNTNIFTLTALLAPSPDQGQLSLGVVVRPFDYLSARKPSCAVIAVHSPGRSNPSVKSTEWIQQRRQLEAMKQGDVDEVVLMNSEGGILEGLSSNFGVLLEGEDGRTVLQTAPLNLVLDGTVMRAIKVAAAELGYLLDTSRPPYIGEASGWSAAFICSTSRLLLPIHRIEVVGECTTMAISVDSMSCKPLLALKSEIEKTLLSCEQVKKMEKAYN